MKRDVKLNVEYKESWYDKYLEWICGYANAKGGINKLEQKFIESMIQPIVKL